MSVNSTVERTHSLGSSVGAPLTNFSVSAASSSSSSPWGPDANSRNCPFGKAAANAFAASGGNHIAVPAHDKSRLVHRPRDATDIDGDQRLQQHERHRRAAALPLRPAVELAKARHLGDRSKEIVCERALAPMGFDLIVIAPVFSGVQPHGWSGSSGLKRFMVP
jgi:hypothetical protein